MCHVPVAHDRGFQEAGVGDSPRCKQWQQVMPWNMHTQKTLPKRHSTDDWGGGGGGGGWVAFAVR